MTGEKEQIPEDIRVMAFEDALKALEDIVTRLESGSVSLEESINIYTRGTWLRQHCEQKLKQAEARIEKITLGRNGEAGLEAFDIE